MNMHFKKYSRFVHQQFLFNQFKSMKPQVKFGSSGNSYAINSTAPAYNTTTAPAYTTSTPAYTTTGPAYTTSQNYAINNAATNLAGGNKVNFGAANTYSSNAGYVAPSYNATYTTNTVNQPAVTTEVREVRRAPETIVHEARNVEEVRTVQPVSTSHVERVDYQHEAIEERPRVHYDRKYGNQAVEHRVEASNHEDSVKPSKCCGTPCWALLGLLGLLGVVLGMLFGLGVIGGLNGPEWPTLGGGAGSEEYSDSVVSVETTVLENSEAPHTDYQFPPEPVNPTPAPTPDVIKPVHPPVYVPPTSVDPVYIPPTSTAPVASKPVYAPVNVAPVYIAPVSTAPVSTAPVSTYSMAPVSIAPVSTAPVSTAPVSTAPVSTYSMAPVSSAPVASSYSVAPSSSAPVASSYSVAPSSSAPVSAYSVAPSSSAPVSAYSVAPSSSAPVSTSPMTLHPVQTNQIYRSSVEV